ncbi:MAG: outer membrane beta-barrel protein [Desulfohalobiaceae bacterium]
MKSTYFAAALTVFLFLGMHTPAHAQHRVFFTPSLTVSGEFTDNLFQTEEDEESELITVVSPRAAISVEGKRTLWELSYEPGFSFYNEYDPLNTIRHSASLTGDHQLSKHLSLTLADNFFRTEQPYRRVELTLEEPESGERAALEERIDSTIRRSREPRYSNDALARLDYQFGARDSAYIAFNNRIFRDESPEGEDSQSYSPSTGFEYWLGTKDGLLGDFSYTRGVFRGPTEDFHNLEGNLRYTHRFNRFLEGFTEYTHIYQDFVYSDDEYHVYNPAAGMGYTFAEDAHLEVGLEYFIQDRKTGDDDSGMTVNLDMDKTWSKRRWAFRLSGSSGYEQTYFGSENLGLTEYYEAGGRLEYSFTRYFQSSLSADYRYSRYLDEDPEREDHVASASCGLTYQATQWVSLSLEDIYRIVESDEEFSDYQENRVILSLTVAPGPTVLWK